MGILTFIIPLLALCYLSESDEAQRVIILNRALGISLESTESLMDAFAAKLKTPSYILYSIFIFISLALVALLPSVTLVGMKPEIVDLIFLYDLIFSALPALYSGYIFMRRPVAFTPDKFRIPILTLLISSRRNALL